MSIFLKHYLGTHTNAIAEELAEGSVHEIEWHKTAPLGKMDLIVDLNFRMDTSAAVLRHRAASGDLVREGGSEFDRHAQLHPSAVGRGAALLGIEERLADLPRRCAQVLGASAETFSRSRGGSGGEPAGARHRGRGGATADRRVGSRAR